MGYERNTRRDLGPVFSEAARLLWVAIEKSGMTRAEFARTLGLTRTRLHKLLYGEQRAGRAVGVLIEKETGIGLSLWDEEPKRVFVLPANRPSTPPRAA